MKTKKIALRELGDIGLLTVGKKNHCGKDTIEHITICAEDGSIVAWVNTFQASFDDGKDRVCAELLAASTTMLRALQKIEDIKNNLDGGDWDEIEEARMIAYEAIAAAKGKR